LICVLRAKLLRPCGVGTKANQDASYPFLVQSLYRGIFHHYAGEGAVKSCKIGHGSEQVDLCTAAHWPPSRRKETLVLSRSTRSRLNSQLLGAVQSTFRLTEGSGEVEIIRTLLDSTDRRPPSPRRIHYCLLRHPPNTPRSDRRPLEPCRRGRLRPLTYAYVREAELPAIQLAEALVPQVNTA